jgi:EAL domain-containing protein (putative c-di-GMP-specific phosphodiesterase class I)
MLKIDRSFVSAASGMEIARAVVALAAGLDAQVLAEGVETAQQRDMLLGFGCRLMQGFFFCPPLPADELLDFLGSRERV